MQFATTIAYTRVSGTVDNVGLNCMSPLTHGFCLFVCFYSKYYSITGSVVEFMDLEPQIGRNRVYRRLIVNYPWVFTSRRCP